MDNFGTIIFLFLLVLFFLWLLTGGPHHAGVDKPIEQPILQNETFVPQKAIQ